MYKVYFISNGVLNVLSFMYFSDVINFIANNSDSIFEGFVKIKYVDMNLKNEEELT